MTKKTVGQVSYELAQKTPDNITVREQQEGMLEDYMKHLTETIDDGYKKYPDSFFVEVQTKRERLMTNVFRNYFFHRKSCPTPNNDQSVYRYNREEERIEHLWTIPDKETCDYLIVHATSLPTEEKQLLQFVVSFKKGFLLRLSKRYNGEKLDSPLLMEQ